MTPRRNPAGAAPGSGLRLDALCPVRAGRALLVADLQVTPGTAAVVAAPSGSGASSLAAAVAGLLRSTGAVFLDGRVVCGPPSARRAAGLAAVLPEVEVAAGCTVMELLTATARDREAPTRVLDALPALAERRRLATDRLSGGERQLLRVALAVTASPRSVVVDDPLGGLAVDAVDAVLRLVDDLLAAGAAVLWIGTGAGPVPRAITHDLHAGRLVSRSPSP